MTHSRPPCSRGDGRRRRGHWLCRHCRCQLRDSLELAVHLGYNADSLVDVIKGRGCRRQDIVFRCAVHGEEEP